MPNKRTKKISKNSKYVEVHVGVKLLLSFLLIVIILQTAFMVFYFQKMTSLDLRLQSIGLKIDNNNADAQSKISELSGKLLDTQTDLGTQIGSIKAKTSADFSGIIENSVKSVVTIKTDVAQGTGFIITDDGYLVTNAHVLQGATTAEALTSNQEVKNLKLIGYNHTMDLALLKLDGTYNSIKFGDSNNAKVGEKVIAIGNPLGLSFSASEGIISAVDRTGSNNLPYYIQTDAALNPGNSGGPLINTNGKVIGINNFKISGGENIGFALESNYMELAINQIATNKLNHTIIDYQLS